MPPLSLLIKPASGSCNMRCRYCFYTDETENREVALLGRLSREAMETIVDKALAFADGDCTIAFQGGEPTLAGLDFYRALTDYVKSHSNPSSRPGRTRWSGWHSGPGRAWDWDGPSHNPSGRGKSPAPPE